MICFYCSAMACSSKPNKLWSAMSAILFRGLVCCFDYMVPKWYYLWLWYLVFWFVPTFRSPANFVNWNLVYLMFHVGWFATWLPLLAMYCTRPIMLLLMYFEMEQKFRPNWLCSWHLAAYILNHSFFFDAWLLKWKHLG